ncbi:MAG TPA: DUF6600 domain-containing protein [Streptosporangiaceae bacterium]|nr:DUF6600 domain-containing protein [Streptosporangiaceae bacterium]
MSKRRLSVFGGIGAGMLICLGAFGAALSQDEPQGDQTQMIEQLGESSGQAANAPARAAQLSDVEGSVSLEPAGTTTWTGADVNRPLTLGDKVWADTDSRAEIDIGDAVIRLGSMTGFSFLNLDDQTAQMQVTAGTVIVHVDSLASGEQDEIDTPNVALTLQQAGTYRVEVNDAGDTTVVKVSEGAALVSAGGQSYPVAAQQSVTFTGTNGVAAEYATLGAPDSLDDWSLQRDQQEQQQAEVAQDYVPPDTVGEDDLGSYGSWQETPDWGYAWFPNVAADWAPYSIGYWVWVSPWGWTWVDQEPWGYAPFHYGRWGYWGHRWCWVPGPRGVRPVYSPAMVAWVGGGAAVGVAAGARVGWLPLGPGDRYGARGGDSRFVNSEVPGAVTVVPDNVFTGAQPVGPRRVSLPRGSMAALRPTTAAPAITPQRQSVLGANAGMRIRTPPSAIANRPVVARLAPPRAPVSFTSEQAAIRANGGRPLSATQLSRMRPYTPAAPVRLSTPTRSDRPPSATGQPMRPGAQGAAVRRYMPPPRVIAPPEQRYTVPERPVPQQRYTPPERPLPQPHFTPHESPPREAPARAPESHPQGRPQPPRADVTPSAPAGDYAAALGQSPPPMYRPIPSGPATARPAPSPGRLTSERPRHS